MLLDIVLLVIESLGTQEPTPAPPPQAPAPVVEAAPTIECARCAGKKVAVETCLACAGTGKVGCRLCDPLADERAIPWDENITEAKLRDVQMSRRKQIEGPVIKLPVLERAPRGRIACPASRWHSDQVREGISCRWCSGSDSIPCAQCDKKGARKCVACGGKGSVERTCEACVGAGSVLDPTRLPAAPRDQCPWCKGSHARVCRDCETGAVERACSECLGEKSTVCRTCGGTHKRPCFLCLTIGRANTTGPVRTNQKCTLCSGGGSFACDECDVHGRRACAGCGGAGRLAAPCLACLGDGKRPCSGCFLGVYGAWEAAAALCERAGERTLAAEWLEAARDRVANRAAIEEDWIAVTKTEKLEAGKRRTRELERLMKRIASLRAPAPASDPGPVPRPDPAPK